MVRLSVQSGLKPPMETYSIVACRILETPNAFDRRPPDT